jgi:hypothetical protein
MDRVEEIRRWFLEDGRDKAKAGMFPTDDIRHLLTALDAAKAENAGQAHTIGRLVAAMKAIVDEVSEAGPKHPVNCIQAVNAMGAVLSDLGLTWSDAVEDATPETPEEGDEHEMTFAEHMRLDGFDVL